jgi:uncharacterized protein DUF3892
MPGRIKVTEETDTGQNVGFKDTRTGEEMTRSEFVRKIEQGQYPKYHVREIDGVKTPASNPDGSANNNLG